MEFKKDNTIPIEKIFLIISAIFGLLFVFITPPFQTPDEPAHFYRAYQISELKVISQKQEEKAGGYLPKSLKIIVDKTIGNVPFHPENKVIINEVLLSSKIPLDSKEKEFVEFPNTIRYSPVAYFPQAFGISIGRLFNFSSLMLMYAGRFFNLFIWVLLVYFAIKIIPISKYVLFLLALMPMSIFLSASLSADTFTNGISFLLIAICFQYALGENNKVGAAGIFVLFLLSLILALTKQIYFLLAILFLLIPVKKIGNKTKYFLVFTVLLVLCLSVIAGWYVLIKDTMVPLKTDISISGQILFVLNNPTAFLEAAVKTLSSKKYISHFVGQLGWLDTDMSWFFLLSYFFMLIFVSLTDIRENIKLSLNHKVIIFLVFMLNVFFICLSQYITWTPVGRGRIQGLQGRYFISISLLFFMLLYNTKMRISSKWRNPAIICFSLLSLIYTIIIIVKRYYL
ncbi:MAG: DUF2142 domain-containing protein [Elusimicrobia bacterium]|nr:DUF2142 domain-containing protein [Elusimicrobiota bacterium]